MARGRASTLKPTPSFTTSSCARPSDKCRNPRGSKIGCGVCQNASSRVDERGLGGARAFRVAAHAVDHHQEHGVVGGRDRDSVLIFFAVADEADIRGLDLQ